MARKPFDFAAEGITAEEWKAMTVKEKGRVRTRVHARAKRASMTPEQRSELFKKARNRDSYRAWRSEHLKKPEVKQRAAERNRKRWLEMPDEKKEEFKAKQNEYRKRPEVKAKRNEYKRRHRALLRAKIVQAQAKAAAERRAMAPIWKKEARAAFNRNPAAIMDRIKQAIPRGYPADVRDDVATDITIALFDGEIALAEIERAASKFIAKHYRDREWHALISTDAPIAGFDGLTIGDTLAAGDEARI